ncbi:MAG: aldehyde dehydrogenase family protein, partial [Arenimonas sp.]
MTVENVNPWTGQVEYRYAYFGPAETEARLAAAAKAFPAWSALSFAERAAYLERVAGLLREHSGRIASTMTAEMGKLRREALAEVEKSAGACEYYAAQAEIYMQDKVIATEATRSFVAYEPIGCVFAVMPWNFPIWQVFRFLAPGLMAGNVALLKHAT